MHIGGPFLDQSRRHADKKWYLSYFVPKLHPDGSPVLNEKQRSVLERKRPYYETKTDAQEDKPRIIAQHAAAGAGQGMLTRTMAEEYHLAKSQVPEVPLSELAKFWRLHHPLHATKKLREYVPAFLADVKLRLGEDRHHSDLQSRLKMLCATFGDRIPATITASEALIYLKAFQKKGRTVLNHKRAACNFFNYLHGLIGLAPNPFGGIKKRELPKIEANVIRFLGVGQAERYLRAAERYDPGIVAHEIVQLFAGVRADDEMADFCGEWVHPESREVEIPESAAKTGQREVIVSLEDNFWAWWQAYGRAGRLRPVNYEQRWYRVRVLTEIAVRERADEQARLPIKFLLARADSKAALKGWPWNARRRTFATHHVAKHQSAALTALITRHRGNVSTLHNSYRGRGVSQAQGVAFFAVLPAPAGTVIAPENEAKGIVRRQRDARTQDRPGGGQSIP